MLTGWQRRSLFRGCFFDHAIVILPTANTATIVGLVKREMTVGSYWVPITNATSSSESSSLADGGAGSLARNGSVPLMSNTPCRAIFLTTTAMAAAVPSHLTVSGFSCSGRHGQQITRDQIHKGGHLQGKPRWSGPIYRT